MRFGHRLLSLTDWGDHVEARILDPEGGTYRVHAGYVLAADGNRSGVRESLRVGRSGPGTVAHVVELGFRADLRRVLDGRRLAFAFADRADHAFISWTTAHDGGAVAVQFDPATTDPAADLDGTWRRRTVSSVLGIPAAQITITGARTWEMGGWVADSYRAGRVFLLGDAVHVTPPVSGFGANTGIQDAWNLTTKLVSVLRDAATPRLLDDYEPERRPIGRLTVDQAVRRLGDRAPAGSTGTPVLSEAAVAIGYRYRLPGEPPAQTPLPDADEPGRWHGEPGTRLPHLPPPLHAIDADPAASTLDLVRGGRYLLLTGPAGSPWMQAARQLDPHHTVLDTARLPEHPSTPGETPADIIGTGDHGALLVRPDHVIAWRTTASAGLASAIETLRHGLSTAHLALPDLLYRRSASGAVSSAPASRVRVAR